MSKTWTMPKCGNVKPGDSKYCAKRELVKNGLVKHGRKKHPGHAKCITWAVWWDCKTRNV